MVLLSQLALLVQVLVVLVLGHLVLLVFVRAVAVVGQVGRRLRERVHVVLTILCMRHGLIIWQMTGWLGQVRIILTLPIRVIVVPVQRLPIHSRPLHVQRTYLLDLFGLASPDVLDFLALCGYHHGDLPFALAAASLKEAVVVRSVREERSGESVKMSEFEVTFVNCVVFQDYAPNAMRLHFIFNTDLTVVFVLHAVFVGQFNRLFQEHIHLIRLEQL